MRRRAHPGDGRGTTQRDASRRPFALHEHLKVTALPEAVTLEPLSLRHPFEKERSVAPRARLGDGPLPENELAVRIARARVIDLPALRAPLDELLAAPLLGTPDPDRQRLRVLALGISLAGQELPVPAFLDHHLLPAELAHLVGLDPAVPVP